MAKKRRSQSFTPKQKYRIPPQGRAQMKRMGLTEQEYVERAKAQRKLMAKHKTADYKEAFRLERIEELHKREMSGFTSKVSTQLDGTVEKTFYSSSGEPVKAMGVTASGQSVEYLPIENITEGQFSGVASGTINNICGETAFVGLLSECDNSTHPLADFYCGDESLCCTYKLNVHNVWTPDAPSSAACPCPVNDTVLEWSEGEQKWIGLHPGCGCDQPWNLELSYSGGQWNWACVENEAGANPGNIVAQGVASSASCDPFEIQISWFTTSVNRTFNMTVTLG